VPDLVTIELVGNALLVQRDSLRPPDVRSTNLQLADVRAGQKNVVAAMCIFAADPCPSTGPSPSKSAGASGPQVAEIPADFPIDVDHFEPGGDGHVGTPSRDAAGVVFEPCGTDAFAVPPRDRLAFEVTAPETSDTRELRTYASADEAVKQLEQLRAAVADCPRRSPSAEAGGPATWSGREVDTGYDSFAAAMTYDEGPGGGIWLFTRVGRSVLVVSMGGEFAGDTVWDTLPQLRTITGKIVPSMCLFTEAGC
jgi:hypothetical protein